MQPHFAHQTIHKERRSRHVTRVFQKSDEKEQQQDLRQEYQNASDARDHTIDQKIG